MRNIGLSDFLFVSCLIVIGAIVIPDSPLKNHVKSHQTRNTPQKCDLICPGQQPIPLPPTFMQNCTSSSTTNNTSGPSNPTTARPTRTTTTESGEEESTESNEEGNTNGTARIAKHQRARNKQSLKQHHQSKHRQQKTRKFRKETIFFRREAKSRLFKHHKFLQDKAQLDGCHVVCSEPNAAGKPPVNGGDQCDNGSDANVSSESDEGDNYVDGEDTPIEIIYVPPLEENRRPSDVYQINNYELVEPQPPAPFGFGFDPLFMEGKQKKMKKRKQHGRKKYHKNRLDRKHPPSS